MMEVRERTELALPVHTQPIITSGDIRIAFNANGGIEVYGDTQVIYHRSANETAPEIGQLMKNGTIFAGISPDTNKPMYARPLDEPLTLAWRRAMIYAAEFEGHGKAAGEFRVPTNGELHLLYNNRDKIGGFKQTDSAPDSAYHTSQHDGTHRALRKNFTNGFTWWHNILGDALLRLVCD